MKINVSVILLSIILLIFWNTCCSTAQEKAPDFTLADINGVSLSLVNLQGKVVILDFFDTMCAGCIAQFEHLRTLHSEYPDQLVLISISVSPEIDTDERLRSFVQQHDMQWAVARDTVDISSNYNIRIIPTLTIIDTEGYIRSTYEVSVDWATLATEIDSILSGTNNIDTEPWPSREIVFPILAICVLSVVIGVVWLRRRTRS